MMRLLPSAIAGSFFRSDASSSTSPPPAPQPPPNTAVRSRPTHARRSSTLPSSSSSSTPAGPTSYTPSSETTREGEDLCDKINAEEDLYRILGVGRKARTEDIRRAFLGRSRVCHPDKLPQYTPATPAFQRLSYAYETLSKPASRRLYDLGGGRGYDPGTPREPSSGAGADETLNGVLRNVFSEFMAGDFEMIRAFLNAVNDGNPGVNLGDETVDNIEGAFRRVRQVLLTGQKYLRLVKFELIRLYEIQHSLRSLSYFDVFGRLRLTLALTRVTLEIPLVLDRAMREEVVVRPSQFAPPETAGGGSDERERDGEGLRATGGELQSRGLLGSKVKGVLVLVCRVLEKGERLGT